jgi:HJR/Mrr/RecB family endonuclease
MKKFFLLILLLSSCTSSNVKNNFDATEDMSIVEFEKKLQQYINSNAYPKIED